MGRDEVRIRRCLLPVARFTCHRCLCRLALVVILLCRLALPAYAQPPAAANGDAGLELGAEYSEYNRTRGRQTPQKGAPASFARKAALYLPNRILDFIDIFRVDAGVGPASGAVVRVTKWGQAGMRYFTPASVRIGLRGRDLPFFVEHSNEFGAGPAFVSSPDRRVTPAEVGLGADLVICGVYAGVSLDSAADFILGIFGVDFAEDDLR